MSVADNWKLTKRILSERIPQHKRAPFDALCENIYQRVQHAHQSDLKLKLILPIAAGVAYQVDLYDANFMADDIVTFCLRKIDERGWEDAIYSVVDDVEAQWMSDVCKEYLEILRTIQQIKI